MDTGKPSDPRIGWGNLITGEQNGLPLPDGVMVPAARAIQATEGWQSPEKAAEYIREKISEAFKSQIFPESLTARDVLKGALILNGVVLHDDGSMTHAASGANVGHFGKAEFVGDGIDWTFKPNMPAEFIMFKFKIGD